MSSSQIEIATALKESIEERKAKHSKAQGQILELTKRLKDEYGLSTIKEAKKYVDKCNRLANKNTAKLDKLILEIEGGLEEYDTEG